MLYFFLSLWILKTSSHLLSLPYARRYSCSFPQCPEQCFHLNTHTHTHTIDLLRIICWVTNIFPLEHHSRWKLQPLGQVFSFLFNPSQLPCHIFLSLIDTQPSTGAQYSIIRLLLQTDPYPPLIGVFLLWGPQLCLATAASLPLCTEASLRSPLVLSPPSSPGPTSLPMCTSAILGGMQPR